MLVLVPGRRVEPRVSPLAEPVQEPGEKATLLGSWRGRSQGHWGPAASGTLPCSRPEMGDSEKQVWCHLLSNLQGIKEGCPVLGTSRQTQGRSGSQWRKLGQPPREGGSTVQRDSSGSGSLTTDSVPGPTRQLDKHRQHFFSQVEMTQIYSLTVREVKIPKWVLQD